MKIFLLLHESFCKMELKIGFLVLIFCLPHKYHGIFHDVIVMDDILTSNNLKSIEKLLSSEETQWNFNNLVPQVFSNVSENSVGKNRPNVWLTHFWTTKLGPLTFSRSSVWSKIQQQMSLKIKVTADSLHVLQVSAQISGRGDNTLVTDSCSSKEPNQRHDLIVIVFSMLQSWNKNSYGELMVYDDDDEILKSIHPRNGRIVLLPCSYRYTIKPPSMDCSGRLHTLTIHVSTSNEVSTYPSKTEPSQLLQNKYEEHLEFLNSLDKSNKTKIDVTKYITRQFKTTKGHPIYVFDDIIPKNILDFFSGFIINGTYTNNPPEPDSTDNVPWILAFDTKTIVASPLWNYIQPIVKFVSKKDGFYPYDVSCNNIRSHDTTKIHTDCATDQEEFTLLIYFNRNWTSNNLGETVFFNYNTESGNEMVFAIKPKYGRVAIFHGTIPHSARPPTPLFHGARYTLAIKFASSKEEAFKKTVELDIEPLETYLEQANQDEKVEVQKILEEIRSGKKSLEEIEKIVAKYEKKLGDM